MSNLLEYVVWPVEISLPADKDLTVWPVVPIFCISYARALYIYTTRYLFKRIENKKVTCPA